MNNIIKNFLLHNIMKYDKKFLQKYLQMKNKYIHLKRQYGGNLFETLFPEIIQYIFDYNKIVTDFGLSYGPNRFIHIQGGASIKYHIMKSGQAIDTENLTSDIDIYMVCHEEDNCRENVNTFFLGLKNKFKDYEWKLIYKNGLFIIQVNGTNIMDITMYNDKYNDPDPESSMFHYALTQLGIPNHKTYFNDIRKKKVPDEKTFTSLLFEKHMVTKGIELQTKYLESIPIWQSKAAEALQKLQNPEIDEATRATQTKFYETYTKQSSPEFVTKLEDKKRRYELKLTIINQLLGQ